MQTDIYYRDITKSEYLENYLLENVEGVAEGFFKWDRDAHLTVRVETDRHRKHTRKASYTCEVILKPMRSKRIIKVRKSDENFKVCVAKTTAALKSILSRNSSWKQMHHRTDPMLNYVPSSEELELVGA